MISGTDPGLPAFGETKPISCKWFNNNQMRVDLGGFGGTNARGGGRDLDGNGAGGVRLDG
jgi:hypothetical protein